MNLNFYNVFLLLFIWRIQELRLGLIVGGGSPCNCHRYDYVRDEFRRWQSMIIGIMKRCIENWTSMCVVPNSLRLANNVFCFLVFLFLGMGLTTIGHFNMRKSNLQFAPYNLKVIVKSQAPGTRHIQQILHRLFIYCESMKSISSSIHDRCSLWFVIENYDSN